MTWSGGGRRPGGEEVAGRGERRREGGRGSSRTWLLALSPLVTGCLLLFSYPPFGAGWLAWFALVPLLWAWQSAPRRGMLTLATLAAGAVWGGGIFHPILFVEGGPLAQRLAGFLLTTGAVSTYLTLFSWGSGRAASAARRPWAAVACAPALWVAMEYAMRAGVFGFSVYLGVTQWAFPVALSLAGAGGIHAVSGALVALNALIAQAVAAAPARLSSRGRSRAANEAKLYERRAVSGGTWLAAGAATIALFVLQNSGGWPGSAVERSSAAAEPARGAAEIEADAAHGLAVILVQPGFTPGEYAEAADSLVDQRALLGRAIAVTEDALRSARAGPDGAEYVTPLVVWPETTLHIPVTPFGLLHDPLAAMLRRQGALLLAGFPRPYWEPDPAEAAGASQAASWSEAVDQRERNSAYLFGSDGSVQAIYDKVNVIPIAEAQYAPGDKVVALPVAAGPSIVPVGVGICSDVVEPGHALAAMRSGATSLHYLGSLSRVGSLAALQRAFLSFRAAEHGVYVTLTATTGPTLVVDPQGRTAAAIPGSRPGALAFRIPPHEGGTLYTRLGDWPAGVAGAVLLMFGLTVVRRGAPKVTALAAAASLIAVTLGLSPAAEAARRLTVWIGAGEPGASSSFARSWSDAIARFEQEEGVEVDVDWIGWPGAVERFLEAAAQGVAPDVLLGPAEALPLLARDGLAASLDGVLATWPGWEAFGPEARASVAWGERIYGVPAHASVKSFVYHEAPFLRYGVDRSRLPQTWSEYRTVVERLTVVQGDQVEAVGTAPGWIDDWRSWLGSLWQAGGSLFDAGGIARFAGGAGVDALRHLSDLYRIVDLPGQAGGVHSLEIATGRVASLFADLATVRAARAYRPLHGEYLVVGPPVGRQAAHVVAEYDAWIVSGGAWDRDLAWRFVRAVSETGPSAQLALALGRLPVRRDARGLLTGPAGASNELLAFLEVLEKHGRALPLVEEFGVLSGLLQYAVHLAVTGEAPPERALSDAAEMWSELQGL